eukprot:scaffold97629_cov28-Tisochrysis_lutea.AAC.4
MHASAAPAPPLPQLHAQLARQLLSLPLLDVAAARRERLVRSPSLHVQLLIRSPACPARSRVELPRFVLLHRV